jgi:PTS system nitrogen regulatory IIA component
VSFGATLRLLRTNAGFTLRDLADRIGVSNAYLSRVENGHDAPPTPDRLAALARALDLAPTTLIELADRVAPFASDYLERIPEARELMVEILRRNPNRMDLARIRAFVERELPLPADRECGLEDQFLAANRVVIGLSCSDIGDAIDVAATRLVAATEVLRLATAMRARERSCTSALGAGLAVPHAIVPNAHAAAVVVTLQPALGAETPDGRPLRLLVAHVHPGGPRHTRLLARLAHLADASMVQALCAERDPRRLLRELRSRLD